MRTKNPEKSLRIISQIAFRRQIPRANIQAQIRQKIASKVPAIYCWCNIGHFSESNVFSCSILWCHFNNSLYFFWCSFLPLRSFLSDSGGFLISFSTKRIVWRAFGDRILQNLREKKCSDFMKFDEILSPLNANQYGVSSETTKY